jgi:WD40 repeat protein/GTPase SAR1 family protein
MPEGFYLRSTLLRGHTARIGRIAWSPDGRFLATPSGDSTVKVWDTSTGPTVWSLKGHTDAAVTVSWSPDGRRLASGGLDHTVRIWDVETGQNIRTLGKPPHDYSGNVTSVSWSPNGLLLASCGEDSRVRLWDDRHYWPVRSLDGHTERVRSLSWSPDGQLLASVGEDGTVRVWDAAAGQLLHTLKGHTGWVNSVSWSPDRRLLASGGADGTVWVWDASTLQSVRMLEGHTKAINSVSWSSDGRLLASKSTDNTVRLWRRDTWTEAGQLYEPATDYWLQSIAFHPSCPVLATLGEGEHIVRIWDLDIDAILGRASAMGAEVYTTAKVVLLGDSNIGKSWLATQLIERRTPTPDERGTTHGMRIWRQPAEVFEPAAAPPPAGENREVFLWDFGGQDEYQLVHQMFLHDTTLALVLIDPTRSAAERDKARTWNFRLANQTRARTVAKFLIGAQVDDDARSQLIDQAAIDRLKADCGFGDFFETSAQTGRGIDALRKAIAGAIDWSIGQTTRPELFQRIREQVDARRVAGEVVVPLRTFNADLRAQLPALFEDDAAEAVTDQLARQGLLAKTRMKDGDEALILRVEVVEQHAASLVVLARNNLRGVPAFPEADLGSRQITLPGIEPSNRLDWADERVVLECVAELMIRHGVCFRHHGLLVFPTLFPEAPTEAEAEKLPHTVSLWYDFTGAIDNVYALLVAGLMVVGPFGAGRLTPGRAEFDDPAQGLCGLRRLRRPGGLAHIELFFDPTTPPTRRDAFVAYVEAHLRENGVEVTECRAIKCPACGKEITEETVRERIAYGGDDVICSRCERRTPIQEGMGGGVADIRKRDPQTDAKVLALRQEIKAKLALDAVKAKAVISGVASETLDRESIASQIGDRSDISGDIIGSTTGREAESRARDIAAVEAAVRVARGPLPSDDRAGSVRILHLSDLHFTRETRWEDHLDPLLLDLRHADLGCEVVHHLVISGDFVDKGSAGAFPAAREFVSTLSERLGLSIDRVVLVPGNHDVVDEDGFYQWRSKKDGLKEGEYVEMGSGFLARDPGKWPERFRPFSDHLYHPLFQQPYPLKPEDQGQGFPPENTQVQFLAFNSAWAVDQTDRKRSGLLAGAILRGINAADAQQRRRPSRWDPLRVAVWHHAVLHVDGMRDDEVVGHLTKARVRLVLHGDVHEVKAAVDPFRWPGLTVLGAGAFGAANRARPESISGLYQVIELRPGDGPGGFGWARVYTRAREKANGPWVGWRNWMAGDGGTGKAAYFDVDLKTGGPRKGAAQGDSV